MPLSATLDHVGPMAQVGGDAALMFQALGGHRVPGSDAAAGGALCSASRGRISATSSTPTSAAALLARAREALRRGRASGRRLRDRARGVDADVYLHIVLPEASWYHAPLLDRHAASYSPGVRLRLEMGRYVLAEDYVRAMHCVTLLGGASTGRSSGCDALLLPRCRSARRRSAPRR